MAEPMANKDMRGARQYDVRSAIAALFTACGVIVTLTGVSSDEADLAKSQGINVSLWTGLGMPGAGRVLLDMALCRAARRSHWPSGHWLRAPSTSF